MARGSTFVPITLALALIGLWMSRAEASDCVQKVLPPANFIPVMETASNGFGVNVFTPNELTMAVVDTTTTWPSANNYYGGVWIYRRENTSVDFELLQFVGNGTIMQTVVTAFGAGDYIVVAGRVDAVIPVNNYTVLVYDDVAGEYVVDQILDAGIGFTAPSPGGPIGGMCSSWIFADFTSGSTRYLLSFFLNPDSETWSRHGTVLTYSGADATLLIGASPSCTRLVVRKSTGSGATFLSFKFSVADSNWVVSQNWETPRIGTRAVHSIAVGDTRLYTGQPSATYNMTAENQPTNPNNVTSIEIAGVVSEYLWNGTQFILEKEQLFQKTPAYFSECGWSVALSGNTLVVGCPTYNTTYSFETQCDEYPLVCNKTTCAVTLSGNWAAVNRYLFIRGRADQYSLNSETNEFDFVTTRDEICNASLPWSCTGGNAAVSFGASVATVNNEVFIGAPFDWTTGQVYAYGATAECEKCPCKTDPPCLHGGTCHDLAIAPFFFCECPTNYTGVHCGEPRTETASTPSDLAWQLPTYLLLGAAVALAVVLVAVLASSSPKSGGGGGKSKSETGKKGGKSAAGYVRTG